ncbi:hypothetical protein CRE_09832 [Caenorhabditis remanei]|uniref:Uncharacterized protein n=1 Tax=Caenorhabditis remanei TaxID=31234 RepID=E3NHY2_CAERE|nr:hypothetical protein CRE_09832 [Caenorhabditis remanei]
MYNTAQKDYISNPSSPRSPPPNQSLAQLGATTNSPDATREFNRKFKNSSETDTNSTVASEVFGLLEMIEEIQPKANRMYREYDELSSLVNLLAQWHTLIKMNKLREQLESDRRAARRAVRKERQEIKRRIRSQKKKWKMVQEELQIARKRKMRSQRKTRKLHRKKMKKAKDRHWLKFRELKYKFVFCTRVIMRPPILCVSPGIYRKVSQSTKKQSIHSINSLPRNHPMTSSTASDELDDTVLITNEIHSENDSGTIRNETFRSRDIPQRDISQPVISQRDISQPDVSQPDISQLCVLQPQFPRFFCDNLTFFG